MRTILDIALNDLRIIFKDRSIWINLVIIPLVIAYVVGFANGAGSSGTPTAATLLIDVIDNDGGALAQQFISDLRAVNQSLVLCPLDNDADDRCQLGNVSFDPALAETRLKDQTSLALIEIPAGFTEQITSGANASLIYRANEDASAPSYILQSVQAVTQRLGGALIAARVGTGVAAGLNVDDPAFADTARANASAIWAQNPVQVAYTVAQPPDSTDSSGSGGFSQSFPGIGTMYVMFIVLPAAAAIIQERKNGTLQRLAVMPISRAQILGGKLLSRFTIGMIQYVIMFGFGALLGVRYGADPVALGLVMVAFTLCVTALTLALTTILKNVAQASGITLFLSLTLAPLGGAWWPLDIVPAWMRTVGHISPVAWAMDAFRSLLFEGGSLGTVAVPILVLLAMAAVFFAYGVARFKFTD
ncbi:MAG: ABC transporter permease [Chloroflexota bacterium]